MDLTRKTTRLAQTHKGNAGYSDAILRIDFQNPARQWVARSRACVHPWGSGRVYPNFPDPDLADWTEAYYGTNYERLVRVKRTYDPQNLFRFEQSLRSASTAPR